MLNLRTAHVPFYYVPGMLKSLDGFFLYLSVVKTVQRLRRRFPFNLIDAHFAYPDGFAAVLLARHFSVPVTITLRGTINRLIHYQARRHAVRWALSQADRIFSVSRYLAVLAQSLSIPSEKFVVVPNGVDCEKFRPHDRHLSRQALGIGHDRKVLISVGALAERKGHHRVVEVLPALVKRFPNLLYVVVGGPGVEGDTTLLMMKAVRRWGLEHHVRLVGEVAHELLPRYLSAADVFVLPTRFEGWANVFLEAMACGLPVVTTDVCGNSEVVQKDMRILVPFGDAHALQSALHEALLRTWNRDAIVGYAKSYTWDKAAQRVFDEWQRVLGNS